MHILVIEDNPELLVTYRDILQFARCDVDIAQNHRTAQAALSDTRYDMIISDAYIEDTSIDTLFDTLRTQTPQTRVVVISGMAEIEADVRANGFDFLLKPVDAEHLLNLVRR